MKRSSRWCGVAALSLLSICSIASPRGGQPVPVMTAFTVKLDQAVNPRTAANGAPFTATLKQPVEVDGQMVIPSGASAGGVISKDSPNSAQIELNSVFVNGRSYRITTESLPLSQKASLSAGATLTFHLMLSFSIAK